MADEPVPLLRRRPAARGARARGAPRARAHGRPRRDGAVRDGHRVDAQEHPADGARHAGRHRRHPRAAAGGPRSRDRAARAAGAGDAVVGRGDLPAGRSAAGADALHDVRAPHPGGRARRVGDPVPAGRARQHRLADHARQPGHVRADGRAARAGAPRDRDPVRGHPGVQRARAAALDPALVRADPRVLHVRRPVRDREHGDRRPPRRRRRDRLLPRRAGRLARRRVRGGAARGARDRRAGARTSSATASCTSTPGSTGAGRSTSARW